MECIAARAGCRATARVVNDRAVRAERPRKRRNPGDDLFSRKAALSVSSALESLTAVFGMGTGVASPLESPGFHASGRGANASLTKLIAEFAFGRTGSDAFGVALAAVTADLQSRAVCSYFPATGEPTGSPC